MLCCKDNNLIGLPELPGELGYLNCCRNNIKYLSYHNCQIIKNADIATIAINPVANGFNSTSDFLDSLRDNDID
jgi:hypothetical protein